MDPPPSQHTRNSPEKAKPAPDKCFQFILDTRWHAGSVPSGAPLSKIKESKLRQNKSHLATKTFRSILQQRRNRLRNPFDRQTDRQTLGLPSAEHVLPLLQALLPVTCTAPAVMHLRLPPVHGDVKTVASSLRSLLLLFFFLFWKKGCWSSSISLCFVFRLTRSARFQRFDLRW